MKQADKLTAIRADMARQGVQGFLVPREDEFMGEYVPERGERLRWATGFTGSAGVAVILDNAALVISDSRYTLQIKDQVDAGLFETEITGIDGMAKWIVQKAAPGQIIGYDARLHTPNQIQKIADILAAAKISLKATASNPLDAAWADQPGMPMAMVELFPEQIAGRSAGDKRESIAKQVNDKGASAVILTEGDSIAWLLNIRGNDVPHTPYALSYAFLQANGDVDWFIDAAKITPEVRAGLGNHVQIHAPETLAVALRALAQKSLQCHKPVMFDPDRSAIWFKQILESENAKIIEAEDPCLLPKACKTQAEQDSIRKAHIRDGVAVTKFLYWLDQNAARVPLTELDIADKLAAFRKADAGFRDTSFDTIAGWGPNGAIVHYRAMPEKFANITPPGLLLLDSGAQYLDGTTDITRTIPIGAPTDDMKDAFTRVLKGHIGIAALTFPVGITGQNIDVLARKALWDAGMDYGHGTGHGVGCYLSVHEEGGSISLRGTRPFAEGMVVSNEPGFYAEGAFGIRIENLVLVQKAKDIMGKPALSFETLTLVPIDRRMIRLDLMTHEEIAWLDEYHARVERAIGPHLEPDALRWLKGMTAPLRIAV